MKFRCRGCGRHEYILLRDYCPACHMHGPPWRRWLPFLALAVLLGYYLLR